MKTSSKVMNIVQGNRMARTASLFLLLVATAAAGAPARVDSYLEAPRVAAALEHGAAELGIGIRKNHLLAVALYCDAGTMGSPEGFFRVGRLLASGPRALRNAAVANAYLALAARLGSHEAVRYYDPKVENAPIGDGCGALAGAAEIEGFDLYSGTRLFISSIYGKKALGVFAAAYDLLQRLLVSYMQVINSASFPLIRRAWDNDDLYQVNQLARSNVFLLAFPTLSVVGALVIMWPRLVGFFGGGVSSYWMALFIGLGVVFNRLKTFHVDYFSMLNGRTTVLVGNSFLSMGLLAALFFTFGRNGSIVVVTASVASAYFFGLLLATVGEFLRKKKLRVFDFRDVAIGMLPIPVALFVLQVESRFGPYWVAVLYACFMVSFVLALWLFGYAPLRSMFSRRKRDGQ